MAVFIIPVHQAKHYTTLSRLSPLLRDLCSPIPNLQCYRALWIWSSLYKISVQRNYSFIHLVTNINIRCPVLLNYLELLCKLQSSEITVKIWVTIFNMQIKWPLIKQKTLARGTSLLLMSSLQTRRAKISFVPCQKPAINAKQYSVFVAQCRSCPIQSTASFFEINFNMNPPHFH
jgi:hypothetical protein